jgi:hypothetical protein
LYVRSGGVADWPCGTSIATACKNIATAVHNANVFASTTIKVAQGDYAEYISIDENLPTDPTKQLAIEGGWNADFTAQNHNPSLTRITPPTTGGVVVYVAPIMSHRISLRFAYLTLQGANDTHIGGFFLHPSTTNSITNLIVEHCRILSFRGQGFSVQPENSTTVTVTLDDNIIQGNYQLPTTSSKAGAGIYVSAYNGSDVSLTLTNNTITENQALRTGGGIYCVPVANGAKIDATLENNIIAQNKAMEFGEALGVYVDNGGIMDFTLINNTISENQAGDAEQGIYLYSRGNGALNVELKNMIVWGNGTDLHLRRHDASVLTVTSEYSIIGEEVNESATYTSTNNLNVNPLLTTDYHLNGTSPAKDKGICGIAAPVQYFRSAPYDDIDGDLRPGWNATTGCDIGADEYRFPWILFNPALMRHP